MIEVYFRSPPELRFQQIADFRPGSWIYVREADLDDLNTVAELTGIDITHIRDSLDKYEQPRVEYIDDNTILFIRHPGTNEVGLYTETLTLILTSTYVIAIAPHRCELIESLISANTHLMNTQKAKLILHILLKITQEYTNSIKRLRLSIIGTDQPDQTIDSDSIIVLTKNEEILNQYLTSLVPMRSLLEMMASGRHLNFYEKDLDLLEDLMIALRQSEDICRVNIKSIRSLRDSYQIIFTNNVNRTIKILTAATIIVTFPMIIASIYGMNVSLPFQSKPYAFGLIMGISMMVSIAVVVFFRRNKWL